MLTRGEMNRELQTSKHCDWLLDVVERNFDAGRTRSSVAYTHLVSTCTRLSPCALLRGSASLKKNELV